MKKQILISIAIIIFALIIYLSYTYINIQVGLIFFIIEFIVAILFLFKKHTKLHTKLEAIEKSLYKQIKESSGQNFYQLEALLSLYQFIKLILPLPKSREWVASPDYLKINNFIF